MPALNDTQSLLLSTASQREDRSLYPLPSSLSSKSGLTKAITNLIRAALAEERETTKPDTIVRVDRDLSFGVFATAAGLDAIGIEPEQHGGGTSRSSPHQRHWPAPRSRQFWPC